jgi:anti-sigma regulatory factor (Ser/Thr protein kinase)
VHEGAIVFVLTDTGKEFDPTLAPEADITLSADDREIGGLGIFLIRQIMNEVRYERIEGKNVLTLEKRL